MVSNSANHLRYKCTKTMTKQKNLEKTFSFHQLVHWELQFLSKCHVFTDLPVASHMSCLTWVRNSFPFSSDTVWSLLAEHAHSLPPSSCPVSQVHGEAYKICGVHCRLRRLRTSALKVLTVTDRSHPCGILRPGSWDMAWISSASCLPQAGIVSVVCTCHLSCP